MDGYRYVWQAGDTLVHVASRFLRDAGYADIYAYIDDIYAANPAVFDYVALASGTVLTLPWKA